MADTSVQPRRFMHSHSRSQTLQRKELGVRYGDRVPTLHPAALLWGLSKGHLDPRQGTVDLCLFPDAMIPGIRVPQPGSATWWSALVGISAGTWAQMGGPIYFLL